MAIPAVIPGRRSRVPEKILIQTAHTNNDERIYRGIIQEAVTERLVKILDYNGRHATTHTQRLARLTHYNIYGKPFKDYAEFTERTHGHVGIGIRLNPRISEWAAGWRIIVRWNVYTSSFCVTRVYEGRSGLYTG